jgi:cytochrome P450
VTETQVEFSTFSPEIAADPYPTYAKLRELGRVLWMPAFGGGARRPPPDEGVPGLWLVTSYDDCMAILRDDRVSADPMRSELFGTVMKAMLGDDTPALRLLANLLLFMDPPDHTRLRGLVSGAFTPRRVRDLEPYMRRVVDDLLDRALSAGGMEVIEEFAYLLPVRVICELLGVPEDDHLTFRDWSRELARGLDPAFMIPAEVRERLIAAGEALRDYFEGLISERKRSAGDDMLSALIAAEQEGDKLTHGELLATLGLLLIAGHETTVNLIGNAILQLSRSPDAFQALRADAGLARGAVEGTLRFDPPVQVTGRLAMKDIDFDGHPLGRGQQAVCLIGAANRDPDAFGPTASTYDITRTENNHVAFGAGVHFCLGAPLARLPPDLVRQLHEEPIVHPRQAGPVELRIAFHRAAIPEKSNGAWCGLVRGEQIDPQPIVIRGRLSDSSDVEGVTRHRITKRRTPLGAVLADDSEEERAMRLVLQLEPRNGRASELSAVEPVEAEHGGGRHRPDSRNGTKLDLPSKKPAGAGRPFFIDCGAPSLVPCLDVDLPPGRRDNFRLPGKPGKLIGREIGRTGWASDGIPGKAAVLKVDEIPLQVPVELPAAPELKSRIELLESFQRRPETKPIIQPGPLRTEEHCKVLE